MLHGHPVTYRRVGEGEVVLLVHGITSSSRTWREVMPGLGESFEVIAPDLLGHGTSAKPRGDYSLGAYASGLRDLLVALDVSKATVVGLVGRTTTLPKSTLPATLRGPSMDSANSEDISVWVEIFDSVHTSSRN